jgi:prepilin-type N-terminal cleavage/methylation domain-containing protein
MGHARRGFTLIELLVVVSIIALLISILLPSLGRAKELANRVHCSANLNGITKSFIVYGQENADEFPVGPGPSVARTYNPMPVNPPTANSLDGVLSLIMTDSSHQGDALSPFYILIAQQVNPKIFICKSDRLAGGPAQIKDSTGRFYDTFLDKTQICYAIAYPWTRSSRAPWWRNSFDTNMVVASDMAPFKDAAGYKDPAAGTGSIANSGNHEGAGQNVSYADGHCEFVKNPKVGPLGENIFTLKTTPTDATGVAISTSGTLPPGTLGPAVDDFIMIPTRSADDYGLK